MFKRGPDRYHITYEVDTVIDGREYFTYTIHVYDINDPEKHDIIESDSAYTPKWGAERRSLDHIKYLKKQERLRRDASN